MKNIPSDKSDLGVIRGFLKIMKEQKISITALAEKMGYDYQRLYRIIAGYSPLYFGDAVKIAQALDINIGELIRAAALEDLE